MAQYGYNEIAEKSVNPFLKFLTYFWGPIPWMIEAAVILSALVRHWPDFFIILVLLLANAGVGFWEEYQAGNAIAALKAKLAIRARIRRDGKWGAGRSAGTGARRRHSHSSRRHRAGGRPPVGRRSGGSGSIRADRRVVARHTQDWRNGLLGLDCPSGRDGCAGIRTGQNTYFGKTAQLVQEAHTVSHFQRAVLKIGDYLIALAVVLVILILAVALFRGDRMTTTLQFALVLTVAAIPVAMPTVLSVTMAVGARVLAAKQAIVSRLAAIEELAGMDVLCSDKTGTLTQNKLTLGEPFCVDGMTPEQVILSAALASRAEDQDTIDLAVLSGLKIARALDGYRWSTTCRSTRCISAPRPPLRARMGARSSDEGRAASDLGVGGQRCAGKPCRREQPSTHSQRAASVPWAWHSRTRRGNGSFLAYSHFSIHLARIPRRPSLRLGRWA